MFPFDARHPLIHRTWFVTWFSYARKPHSFAGQISQRLDSLFAFFLSSLYTWSFPFQVRAGPQSTLQLFVTNSAHVFLVEPPRNATRLVETQVGIVRSRRSDQHRTDVLCATTVVMLLFLFRTGQLSTGRNSCLFGRHNNYNFFATYSKLICNVQNNYIFATCSRLGKPWYCSLLRPVHFTIPIPSSLTVIFTHRTIANRFTGAHCFSACSPRHSVLKYFDWPLVCNTPRACRYGSTLIRSVSEFLPRWTCASGCWTSTDTWWWTCRCPWKRGVNCFACCFTSPGACCRTRMTSKRTLTSTGPCRESWLVPYFRFVEHDIICCGLKSTIFLLCT